MPGKIKSACLCSRTIGFHCRIACLMACIRTKMGTGENEPKQMANKPLQRTVSRNVDKIVDMLEKGTDQKETINFMEKVANNGA